MSRAWHMQAISTSLESILGLAARGYRPVPEKRPGEVADFTGILPPSIVANREPFFHGAWRKQPYAPRSAAWPEVILVLLEWLPWIGCIADEDGSGLVRCQQNTTEVQQRQPACFMIPCRRGVMPKGVSCDAGPTPSWTSMTYQKRGQSWNGNSRHPSMVAVQDSTALPMAAWAPMSALPLIDCNQSIYGLLLGLRITTCIHQAQTESCCRRAKDAVLAPDVGMSTKGTRATVECSPSPHHTCLPGTCQAMHQLYTLHAAVHCMADCCAVSDQAICFLSIRMDVLSWAAHG